MSGRGFGDALRKRRYGLIHVAPIWDVGGSRPTNPGPTNARPANQARDDAFAPERLRRLPVVECSARSCALFLWAPGHWLTTALRMIEDWGFRFQDIAFVWSRPHPPRTWGDRRAGGLMAERIDLCLLGTRGAPRRQDARVHRLIHTPRADRGPYAAYERMTRLIGDRPCLDIAARGTPLRGWDRWSPGGDAPEARTSVAKHKPSEQGVEHGGSATRGGD